MLDNLTSKPLEFYGSIVAASLYVYESNKEKPFTSRLLMTLSSALMGFSIGPALAEYTGVAEVISTMVVTAVGFFALELGTALIKDREFIKDIIARRSGGGE